MRKLFIAVFLVLCFATYGYAGGESYSSGVTSNSGVNATIYNGPALLTGATVICNGTTDTDLHILDSGVTKVWIRAEGSYAPSVRYDFSTPIMFNTNIQLNITLGTSNGRAVIEYIPR